MKLEIETPTHLIDVNGLALDKIETTPEGGLRSGALVRTTDLAAVPRVRRDYGQISVAHQRADSQPTLGRRFDFVERKAVYVDQMRRRFDFQLHQVEKIRAARNELGALDARREGDRCPLLWPAARALLFCRMLYRRSRGHAGVAALPPRGRRHRRPRSGNAHGPFESLPRLGELQLHPNRTQRRNRD